MFIDSRQLSPGAVIESDVCVVGAGAAGITIARALARAALEVTVLESGGFEFDQRTQSLYEGKNTGLPTFPLHVNRLRYFGGTTNHWAGHCRPLSEVDFKKRDWLPHSGWPISKDDLYPYYLKARPVLGLGECQFENLRLLEYKTGLTGLALDRGRLQSSVYGQSPPTRFGSVYRDELGRAPNVKVYLNANVLELVANETASRVETVRVACLEGPRFSVRSKIVILATGGMENARILLLSDGVSPQGLGNDRGLVGGFFMDHIVLRPGVDISLTKPGTDLRLYHYMHRLNGGVVFTVLTATHELIEREKIPNFRAHLVPSRPRYPNPAGTVFSALDGHPDNNGDPARPDGSIAMHLVLEPIPNPDSRVSLSQDRDALGQRRLQVNWLLSRSDLNNAHRALELVGLEFGRIGLGRAYGDLFRDPEHWPENLEAGKHHCGTTRMSDHPGTGVVDANCRVFGIDNLYIAGSSVFPTIGYANPTFTIVALALRMAEHIRGLV